MSNSIVCRLILCCLLLVGLSGCAAQRAFQTGEELVRQERYDEAVFYYTQALKEDPGSFEYRARLAGARTRGALIHLSRARELREEGRDEEALREYAQATALDPSIAVAGQEMTALQGKLEADALVAQAEELHQQQRNLQAKNLLEQALQLTPDHARARELLTLIKRDGLAMVENYELDTASTEPISLKFKDAKVKDVFKILSRLSGITFIFDEDVDRKTVTVDIENGTFSQALELILKMNELGMRVLNPKTVILYPKTKDKEKQYEDQIIQTFYLSNIDAKKAVNLLRTMLQLRKIYVHEELNALVIRDGPEVIRLAQQILEAADRSDSEVLFALELIEVSHTDDFDLGPRLVETSLPFGLSRDGSNFVGRTTGLSNLQFLYTVPSATFDIRKELSDSEILANPTIRVKNGAKAKVHVGSREPIVTTTQNADGAVTSTNIQYVDVGVKLDLEAAIQLDNTVKTKVSLEVSNKGADITTSSGNVAFPISTTNAQTELVLQDGERTILGGLIRNDDSKGKTQLPLIGAIPLLGDLLASHSHNLRKREILLSITPHVVKQVSLPKADVATIWSGSEDELKAGPTLKSFAVALDAEQNKLPPALVPAVLPADDEKDSLPARGGSIPGRRMIPAASRPVPAPAPSVQGLPDNSGSVGAQVLPEEQTATDNLAPQGADAAVQQESVTPEPVTPAAGRSRLFLAGPTLVDAGQDFAVDVQIDEINGLFSAPLFVRYDPNLLEFLSAYEGEFLTSAGAPTVFTVSPDPAAGQIIVGIKQETGGNGASGGGNLFHLVFLAKQPGQARITPERLNFRDSKGKPILIPTSGLTVEVR